MNLFSAALKITAIGMAGIFVFMFIFYLSIKLIDRFFPPKIENENPGTP